MNFTVHMQYEVLQLQKNTSVWSSHCVNNYIQFLYLEKNTTNKNVITNIYLYDIYGIIWLAILIVK